MLFGFGLSMIAIGFYYRTPIPVQPMKAIGAIATTQAAQTATITAGAVYGATLVTGAIWLTLALTGATRHVARIMNRPVMVGIILGLGLSFMFDGARLMATGWWISATALLGTLAMLTNKKVPAMFVLLAAGIAISFLRDPSLFAAFGRVRPDPHWPAFSLGGTSLHELVIGALFLAIPQVPLTLGNAVLAITEENNRLFADRAVSERQIAATTGLMNIGASLFGGVPMCHGAGGMAGHVAFGARTGGATIMLGALLLIAALLFGDSVGLYFSVVPQEVLGVILFLAGAQLALGSCDFSKDKGERFTTVATAGLAMWNVGIAFLIGFAIYHAFRRKWIRV